jgi:hypothetical protein
MNQPRILNEDAVQTLSSFVLRHSFVIRKFVIRHCRAFFIALTLPFILAASGCLGPYHIGNDTLYPADVQTVYVPMFESDSFRPFLGERLTEAVCKQIETDTPFKVVNSPNADSVLSGRIVNDTKRVVIENRFDDPRDTEYNMQVIVTWANRKGDVIRQSALAIPPSIDIGAKADIVPEYGRSVASEQQQVIDKLAAQIVGLMESPW